MSGRGRMPRITLSDSLNLPVRIANSFTRYKGNLSLKDSDKEISCLDEEPRGTIVTSFQFPGPPHPDSSIYNPSVEVTEY